MPLILCELCTTMVEDFRSLRNFFSSVDEKLNNREDPSATKPQLKTRNISRKDAKHVLSKVEGVAKKK